MRFAVQSLLLAALLVAITACTAAAPRPSGTPTAPSRPPTLGPTNRPSTAPSATPAAPPSGVIVTFDVEGERYRILLTDPDDIAIAARLLAGEEAPRIPSGLIVRDETGVNTGHSWSIDPQSVEFADMTIEVCDGLPSHVEDGTLEGDRYCPWGAEVVAIRPAR